MSDKKNFGAYYTPIELASFVIKHICPKLVNKNVSVLEPSVGDGAFLKALHDSGINISNAIAVDIDDTHFHELSSIGLDHLTTIKQDFLSFDSKDKYSLIIGNPPYIKKTRLTLQQIDLINKIYNYTNFKSSSGNIWVAFMLKCVNLLSSDGIIAFILPSEFLQVKFAEELRVYMMKFFQRIEIVTFTNLLFECKGQDTILFIGYKEAERRGVYFSHSKDSQSLSAAIFENKDYLTKSNFKWIHHQFLNRQNINFIQSLIDKTKPISFYCETAPGIVTAANKYFIVNETIEKEYNLKKYSLPILQKSSFTQSNFIYAAAEYDKIRKSDKPSIVLHFIDKPVNTYDKNVIRYLEKGEDEDFKDGYKCGHRKLWYVIPNFPKKVPSGFVFKRCHSMPKILRNDACVYITDSAYEIRMKEKYDIESFIYTFYNSLTLICAELYGRKYGGGVLELTPSEFKNLPMPYMPVPKRALELMVQEYEQNNDMNGLIEKIDDVVLKSLNISLKDLKDLQKLRIDLFNERTMKK